MRVWLSDVEIHIYNVVWKSSITTKTKNNIFHSFVSGTFFTRTLLLVSVFSEMYSIKYAYWSDYNYYYFLLSDFVKTGL